MIKVDEEALICDLAEFYNIYEYRQLPPTKVAVFACGLSESSRIKKAISGEMIDTTTYLLAGIVDRLSLLVWSKTKSAQKGTNKPQMLTDLLGKKASSNIRSFTTSEEFEREKQKILERG